MNDVAEPQPPQGTYTGGEAVQSRTDPDGTEYIFDNDAGNWVPVGRRDMSQPNAADNTRALASGLRAAGVPEAGPVTPPPQAPVAPPPAAVQSPQAQVTPPQGPMPAPPPATDPALAGRLGASPPAVMPPLASPDKVAQMRALQPVKSTYNPPSQPQISDYQLREYKFLVQSGKFKPADAALAVGLNPKAIQAPKRYNVKGYLVDENGNLVFSPPADPNSTARLEQSQQRIDQKAEEFKRKLPPQSQARVDVLKQQRLAVVKQMETDQSQKNASRYGGQLMAIDNQIDEEYRKAASNAGTPAPKTGTATGTTPPAVVPPAGQLSKAPPAVGTVIKGYRFKGGDPSKKENWDKV